MHADNLYGVAHYLPKKEIQNGYYLLETKQNTLHWKCKCTKKLKINEQGQIIYLTKIKIKKGGR